MSAAGRADSWSAAVERGYWAIRADHIVDLTGSFVRRVSLQLSAGAPNARPVERLKTVGDKADPGLLELYFQYGRYLLISSSRPRTQPANLRGIWRTSWSTAMEFDYTADIDAQWTLAGRKPATLPNATSRCSISSSRWRRTVPKQRA